MEEPAAEYPEGRGGKELLFRQCRKPGVERQMESQCQSVLSYRRDKAYAVQYRAAAYCARTQNRAPRLFKAVFDRPGKGHYNIYHKVGKGNRDANTGNGHDASEEDPHWG